MKVRIWDSENYGKQLLYEGELTVDALQIVLPHLSIDGLLALTIDNCEEAIKTGIADIFCTGFPDEMDE